MSRIKSKTWTFLALGLVVALAAADAVVADEVRESRSKLSWTVVDDDGTRHSETIEFDGPRPFLGVQLGPVREGGARIESVIEDSPAAGAGLREGDVVVGYDGHEIETPWDLTRAVLKTEPGEQMDIEVLRDGVRKTIRTEIGENDDWAGAFAFGDGDFSFDIRADAFNEHIGRLREMEFGHAWSFRSGRPRLGVQLVNVTGELREHLGSSRDEGVLVGKVLSETPAEEAGVEVGDLIVAVDGEAVGDHGDLIRLLRERDGETLDLEIIRDGRPLSLGVTLPERDDTEYAPGRFDRHRRPSGGVSADQT